MPGIVNSHKARIRKNARFLRLEHLKNNKGSLYLSDLDTEENKYGNNKIPVYIPYGDTIDILVTDRTMTSYQQGSIRGFIDQGLLSGWIVQNLEIGNSDSVTLPLYQVEFDEEFVKADTTQGDVLISLPKIFSGDPSRPDADGPSGQRFSLKKVSDSGNRVVIEPFAGDLIEGQVDPYIIEDYLGSVILGNDGGDSWWVLGGSSQNPAPASVASSYVNFNCDRCVPEYGALFLKIGTVYTSSTPWVAPTDERVAFWSISVDAPDPNPYAVELFINGSLSGSFPLPQGSTSATGSSTVDLSEGDKIALRVVRQSGVGKSAFQDVVVSMQLIPTP